MCAMKSRKVAIVGTVGVPASYGGFETLAENLVAYHDGMSNPPALTVYCSSKAFDAKPETYRKARLQYVRLDANGAQSIPYDILSILGAVRRGHDRLLLLGVSGAIIIPVLKLISSARIVTNVDGIEWRREKWRGGARRYLRFAEKIAVRFSDEIIADNKGIADYLEEAYGCEAHVISYGGDHAVVPEADPSAAANLPGDFALGLCRIEPENNVDLILEAFESLDRPLVFVGNWDKSVYGRELKRKYTGHPTIRIHDPVYDLRSLRAIRNKASIYLHGHSAGGTNPALVEMMHFGIPIAAYDCSFNRYTTEQKALYFSNAGELRALVEKLTEEQGHLMGEAMQDIARRRYTWSAIGRAYFELLEA